MDINYVIGIIGVVLAIVGLIASYYFYKKSIRIKEPVYSIKSNNLISGSASTLDNLSISYKKRKVENLTVSKILFYNRGAETINRQDIATINPLKISSETCTVLDASVLEVNNTANVFKVILEKGSQDVFIDFDYLDKNQGAVIQVVHTGLSSENIGLYGDIKGVEKLVSVSPDKLGIVKPMEVSEKRNLGIFFLVGMLGLYLLNFQRDFSTSLFTSYPWPIGALALVAFVFSLGVPVMFLFYFFVFIFVRRNVIPNGLEKFDE